jgi:para-nitrobenzyl esterase
MRLVTAAAAILTGVIATAATSHGQQAADAQASIVRVDAGSLAGIQHNDVRMFFGIPYASPPVGDLRWRAPEPVKPWQTTRSAEAFGHACMQPAAVGGIALPPEFADMSEDCLYLNVWAPAPEQGQRLPVMVWIHGSAFMFGAGRGFGIDGTSFAKHGVIVVSMNYRLGLFGHFAHPALTSEDTGSNYAMLDLIAALQWVRRNIAAFGGDPEKVTLAGLSAGGTYGQMLAAMPQARGLFHQVISQSGPMFWGWPSLKEAEQRGVQVMSKLAPAASAQALRALPARAIADATDLNDRMSPRPIIDGKLLPDHPSRLLTAERLNVKKMIVGSTNYEGFVRVMNPAPPTLGDQQLIASLQVSNERVQQLYNPTGKKTPKQIAVDVEGDRSFVVGARYVARAMSKASAAVYEYQFSYVPEVLRARLEAAPHSSDQHFTFNQITSAMMWGQRATAADKAMAETMHGYWISFIKTGDPNGDGRPTWPRYDAAKDILLDLSSTGLIVREKHWKERLDAVEAAVLREIE